MKLNYKDKRHEYWLQRGAKKERCKSVTAVAKIPDNSEFLDLWKQRQVAIGVAESETIRESVAAHHDDKNKLNELCDKAMTVAGAHEAAERGTTIHRIAERADKGEAAIETPYSKKVRENWQNALADAKLTVVPELTERCVVYPDRLICGKLDRIFRREDGSLVLADLKSGQRAIEFPHSIAIQLALYAYAPLLAAPWDGIDGETEDFEPLPAELDRTRGLIVHLNDPNKPAQIYEVNLIAGQKIVDQVIWPTIAWRARRDLTRPYQPA